MNFHSEYEREKHERIVKCYNDTVPFYRRGKFKIHFSTFLFFFWIFVWVESAIRYYSLDYVDFSFKNPRIYILPVILLIVGWNLFKPYRSIREKTCFGKISDIKLSKEYVKGKRSGRRVSYVQAVMAELSIDTSDEKQYRIKIPFNGKAKELFEKGVYVTVIMGEKYPVCHDNGRYKGELFCTHCSSMSSSTYSLCFNCRKKLWIKNL